MRDRLLERIERAQAAVAAAAAAGAPETTQRYLRLAESAARGMRTNPRRRADYEGWLRLARAARRGGGKGRAARDRGGPFYQGEPGYCPKCGAPSEVVARAVGDWDQDRECENGHRFSVSFTHSNDPGTVRWPARGGGKGRARRSGKYDLVSRAEVARDRRFTHLWEELTPAKVRRMTPQAAYDLLAWHDPQGRATHDDPLGYTVKDAKPMLLELVRDAGIMDQPRGGKARGVGKKLCLACGGATRPWAGLDWCPRCFAAVVAAPSGGKLRRPVEGRVGPHGGHTEIQALLFPTAKGWTPAKAKAWAKKNDFKYGKVHVTGNYIRLRQRDPGDFRRHRIIGLGSGDRLKAVVGIR